MVIVKQFTGIKTKATAPTWCCKHDDSTCTEGTSFLEQRGCMLVVVVVKGLSCQTTYKVGVANCGEGCLSLPGGDVSNVNMSTT